MRKWTLSVAVVAFCLAGPTGPYADDIDLTTVGASAEVDGALLFQTGPMSTGTGVIDPFVRIHANDTERGYNTDGTPEFDTVGGLHTHSLQVGDITTDMVDGTNYAVFLLDINEVKSGDGSLISLNEVEIYLAGSGSIDDYDLLQAETLIWELDNGDVDNTVELDFALNPGSGAGDMFLYVPSELLGADLSKYVYLYSEFGNPNGSDAGFEEWAIRGVAAYEPPSSPPPQPVPEPSTLLLLGTGLAGIGVLRRRRRSRQK